MLPRLRAAARRDRARLLRPAEVAHARLRELRLRLRRLPRGRPRARRRPRRRRAGRRALADRPPRRRVRRGQARSSSGCARRSRARCSTSPIQAAIGVADHRARDDQGEAQGRAREVLRRRHHAQAEAAREAEGGQEADEAGRRRRGAAGGVPRRAQPRRRRSDERRPPPLRAPAVLRAPVRLLRLRHRRRPRGELTRATSTRCSPSSSSSAGCSPTPLETVFLGGGTPTFTEPARARAPARGAAGARRR